MRTHTLALVLALVSALFFSRGSTEPVQARAAAALAPARERVGIAFGRPPTLGTDISNGRTRRDGSNAAKDSSTSGGAAAATTYLITLERTATNDVKDKILDILLRSGAVVKQTYDYRVFKGVLFTVPANEDKGLTSWQSSLSKQDGVKYVEEDLVVKIQ